MQNINIFNLVRRSLTTVFTKIVANALSSLLGFICLVGVNQAAIASETHQAHTHGLANLTLVSEGGALEIRFESPAISLLGFEHKPNTDQQEAAVESTKSFLKSAKKVLSIQGGNCELDEVDVDIHGPAGQGIEASEKEEHHGDEHAADDEHGDEHDKHNSSETHSEVLATYRFTCSENQEIASISFSLFDDFPNLESIKVNWVTQDKQGQSTLRAGSSILELK